MKIDNRKEGKSGSLPLVSSLKGNGRRGVVECLNVETGLGDGREDIETHGVVHTDGYHRGGEHMI